MNWWDSIETGDLERPDDIEGKQNMIFSALRQVTGIKVTTAEEVEDAWMDMVAT